MLQTQTAFRYDVVEAACVNLGSFRKELDAVFGIPPHRMEPGLALLLVGQMPELFPHPTQHCLEKRCLLRGMRVVKGSQRRLFLVVAQVRITRPAMLVEAQHGHIEKILHADVCSCHPYITVLAMFTVVVEGQITLNG